MRILQVSPFFSPQQGGSAQVVYQMSKELANRGHKVTVLAGDFGTDKANFPKGAFTSILLRSYLSKWGFYFTPGIIRLCRKQLREFELIHLHEVRTFQNIIVSWFARHYKIPYLMSAHGTLPVIVQRKLIKRIFDLFFSRKILENACGFVAVSAVEKEQYTAHGFNEEKIHIVHNGLDLKEFSTLPARGEFRRRMGVDEREKVILYLGRLHKRKGIDILIEAVSKLNNTYDDILLVIAGPDDGEQHHLQSLVDKKSMGGMVRFVGPLYGADKLRAYVDAEVLASPGVYEIFGLVPFEALMCGTPVIVTDDCGAGQLIRQAQAGYTVAYGDADALGDCVKHVLESPEEARKKVMAGQRFIGEQLGWEKIGGEVERLYSQIIERAI